MSPTLRDLVVARALLDEATHGRGFYRRVARALGESLAHLCAAFDRVEADVGVQLMVRSPFGRRRAVLTPAGRRFCGEISALLETWEAAKRAAKSPSET
jgi:DNA-binding transcriptional LysR family regulator